MKKSELKQMIREELRKVRLLKENEDYGWGYTKAGWDNNELDELGDGLMSWLD